MSTTLRKDEITAKSVSVTGRRVTLVLASGKKVELPVSKFPRLATATPLQLAQASLRRGGEALRWDELDEDIQVASVILGRWPTHGGTRAGAGRRRGKNKPVTARLGPAELKKLTSEALSKKISKASIFNDAINIRAAVASFAMEETPDKDVAFNISSYHSLAGLKKLGYGGFRIQLLKEKANASSKKSS
jgi:hypothetical protein